jgi:formylmethanofuran dehydrogenase subunit B
LFYAVGPHPAIAEQIGLLRLVDLLNAYSRWAAYPLPAAPNAWGTAGALAAATGYGHAVLFDGQAALHDGAEFAAETLLESGAVDAMLVLGGEPGAALPSSLGAGGDVPVIVVESHDSPAGRSAAVRLPVAAPGIAARGTMVRLDRVALPLAALLPAEWPADDALLRRLMEEVGTHVPA